MTSCPSSLSNQRILLTGATGFIGGHLAKRLAIHEGATVTGIGRNLARAGRLAEDGVELRRVDITDPRALSEVVRGQDIVFHLAAAMGRDAMNPKASHEVNVVATESLVRQAAAAGVGRLVHISSIAAYGAPDRPVMDELDPLRTDQPAVYGRTKALGELRAAEAAAELGLPLIIIRPGMVYGPGSMTWTVNFLKLVQKRAPMILGGGVGHAHPIYIENLVDGLVLAATGLAAVGRAFNFVDGPVPWREYLGHYARMCDRRPLRAPLWLARAVVRLYFLFSRRPEPTGALLDFYTNRSVYSMTRAAERLNYRPRLCLAEAMSRTEAWLREAGYLKSD